MAWCSFMAFSLFLITFLGFACISHQFELTQEKTYTFSQPQSFIEIRPWWPLREQRELEFRFRTQLAHGLLVHHGILNHPNRLGYDLYIKLEKGKLRIIHIFDNDVTSLFIGIGLNQDVWHKVKLTIDPASADITIVLDDHPKTIVPKSLKNNRFYGLRGDSVQTVLFFGGLNPNDTIWARQYGYEQFIGCLGDIVLKVNNNSIDHLETFSHAQIQMGCIDRCYTDDLCLHRSVCVNHYYMVSCDCFGTGHEGAVCGFDDLATVTLRGYSYVSYKIYDWVDKVHSDHTRISLTFRTSFDDSVLFYGFGETPTRNYIAASLKNGSIHFAIEFGDGPLTVTMGQHLHDDWWHNLTVLHNGKSLKVTLDGSDNPNGTLKITGNHHLHLDPRFYLGGVPIKAPKFGLKSINNYVGSMKEGYFGTVSILERLKHDSAEAGYHGLFPPEYGFEEVEVLPVTFFYPESKIRLTADRQDGLSLHLDFKTNYSMAILAHSAISSDNSTGHWELGLENGAAIIRIVAGHLKNVTIYPVKLGRNLNNGKWHNVKMDIAKGKAQLTVNYQLSEVEVINVPIMFSEKIYIGGSMENPQSGFVGCMRQIRLNSRYMDPRNLIDSDQIEGGEISMDNCQLVDPCARPGACEHGGKCFMQGKRVFCNCTGTGYTGQTCHFSLYRRTCEELFLVGYRLEGVYMIDIDGNGPHPPAYVYCDMAYELTTTTIIANLPPEMVVRKAGMQSFRMEVSYRNFTPDMLQTLIRHSKNCSQLIKFDCFKVPLGLRAFTWFRTSDKGRYLTSFGSKRDSHCKCGDAGNCSNPSKYCNCDAVDQRWRSDEAELHDPMQLGITEMYFLQPDDLPNDAEGRITLGPLKCLEMDTQQYVITFKTSESYLEIPGWKTGDLAFSFRTSHKRAILFYQPAHYSSHSHFKIFLVNENELSFEFSVRGEPKSVNVSSQTPLNSGEWQQVWVDYDKHHVRFTINTESRMIDLEKNEEFGLFEGTLYVGGAPQEFLGESNIKDGFVGCLRGLVINEEVTNLFAYLSPRTPQIVTGCKPSCDPNPCKNGATCHEYWGTYTCECANSLAHSGIHCEHNINANGVTFVTENGHFHQLYVLDGNKENEIPPILTENILINIRTYDSKGLLLYAHDQYNNFVQLHIQDGNQLVFTYNSFRQLVQGIVTYNELTKGKSVQILVQREPERTILQVNDMQTVIPHPLGLADKYRQNPWVAGQELEIVKPPRPPVEPKPYWQIFLGALDKGTMEFSLPGFIGCMTGLKIGQSAFDLVRLVDENPGTENFRKNCRMSCDTDPCKNGGHCLEDWRNVQHKCECGRTSYFGKSCVDDIGGTFDGHTLVKYSFVPYASTYQQVKVQLAFSSSASFDSPAVILFVNSKVDERNYVLVALTPTGELLFEEEDGSQRVIRAGVKNPSGDTFLDGMRHWILYHRNMDQVSFLVDNMVIQLTRGQVRVDADMNNPRFGGESNDVVMVGGMEYIDNRFANYINYKGCLSNVIIVIDSFNIFPLETAYGYRPGGQNLQVVGNVIKGPCASFGKASRQGDNSTNTLGLNLPPEWKPPSPIKIPYTVMKQQDRDLEFRNAEATTRRVGLVLGIFLLILIIALGIYLWRVDWKDKQYRYEEEFDDEGINFPQKKLRLGESNDIHICRNNNGLYYHEPSEINLLKAELPYPYEETSLLHEDKALFIVDNEEPTSEADTKPMEDSEDDIEPASDQESPLKKAPSQEMEWDPSAYSPGDFVSEESIPDKSSEDDESMDDLGEISDDEFSDRDPQISPRAGVRAPLSTVSEASIEIDPEQDLLSRNAEEKMNGVPDFSPDLKPDPVVLRRPARVAAGTTPVFLPNNQRTFANPISYLGGPRIQHPVNKRHSTESILSLD